MLRSATVNRTLSYTRKRYCILLFTTLFFFLKFGTKFDGFREMFTFVGTLQRYAGCLYFVQKSVYRANLDEMDESSARSQSFKMLSWR